MKAPGWYRDWRHEAVHQLQDKNARLEADFGIGTFPRYDYDVHTESIIFSRDGKPGVIASIQIVGTTGQKDWLWSWGNDWWPETVTRDAAAVRAFGEKSEIEELTSAYLKDKDLLGLGWEMAAVTARVAGAMGAYRPPGEKGDLFLVLRNVSFVT